jgi:predicted GIY-YIG superfamily endonuclease
MYYAYVIECKEGTRRVGTTRDMDAKLVEHNKKSTIWTKSGTDWRVIYLEEFSDELTATKKEEWLKTDAGKYYINNLPEQAAA